MGRINTETPPSPPSAAVGSVLPAALEATFAALNRDAASARRLLRQPHRSSRPRGTPRLWDAGTIDPRPDDCWRCDAAASADSLGLCPTCRTDLCA
jgi:hypothetical protein